MFGDSPGLVEGGSVPGHGEQLAAHLPQPLGRLLALPLGGAASQGTVTVDRDTVGV